MNKGTNARRPVREISFDQYRRFFRGKIRRRRALDYALDIRKFEIEHYWKRAAYFWALIGADFTAYAVISQTDIDAVYRELLQVSLASLGLMFSIAWFLVNRGSKFWQENWENHVDLLERLQIGPLYQVVLQRPPYEGVWRKLKGFVTGPAPFSVSKINQVISLYVVFLWVGVAFDAFWKALGFNSPISTQLAVGLILTLTILFIIIMLVWAPTHQEHRFELVAKLRRSRIRRS